MRPFPLFRSVTLLLIVLAWVAVDSFSPWQRHHQLPKWGIQHLPRKLRRLIARRSLREDEDDKDKNNLWKQFEWKPSEDDSLTIALGVESRKLEPRRPLIPPPEDLEPQPWKPFFVDIKRNTTIEKPETSTHSETSSNAVAESTIAVSRTTPSETTNPTERKSTATLAPQPILDPAIQEELAKAADLVREKFVTQVVVTQVVEPLLSQPVQKNVSSDAIRGAALTAATLSLLASKSLVFSGVAGLGAAYIAVSPGLAGDCLRFVGSGAWVTAQSLSQYLSSSNNLGSVAKVLLASSMEAIRTLVVSIEQANDNNTTTTTTTTTTQSNQLAELNQLHADVEQVLIQAEDAMRTVEAAMQNATNETDLERPNLPEKIESTQQVGDLGYEVDSVKQPAHDDDLEDVEDMQVALGETTEEDLEEIGEIVSEEDLEQQPELFSEGIPIGMEGEDEIEDSFNEYDGLESVEVTAGEDLRGDVILEEDLSEPEGVSPELGKETDETESMETIEPDFEFEDEEELQETIEVLTEDDVQDIFAEDGVEEDGGEIFSDEVPDEISSEDKDDMFIMDDEPDFIVNDLEESDLGIQEGSTEFGDEFPENLSGQEDSDFNVLDEDPELSLGLFDAETSDELEPPVKVDFQRRTASDKADEEIYNDWDATIQLAQKGIEGTIVGIDEAVADMSEKANWDAAKRLAKNLSKQDKQPDEVDDEDDVDMEALGRAARAAVEQFEEERKKAQNEIRSERQKWENEMVTSSATIDDDILEELETDEENLEDLAKAARDAVEQFEAQMARDSGSMEDAFDDDVDFGDNDSNEEIAQAARAAVALFEAQQLINNNNVDAYNDDILQSSASNEGTAQDWNALSVVQLKDELKARGLKTKGKKADLILALAAYEAREYSAGDEGQDIPESQVNYFEDTVENDDTDTRVKSSRDWSSLSVVQLKDELKARGLSPKGKKADLITALLDYEASLVDTEESASLDYENTASSGTTESRRISHDGQLDQTELSFDDDVKGALEDDLELADPSRVRETSISDIVGRDWSKLTASELKEELRAVGLSVKGKRSDLINRLREFEESAEKTGSAASLEPESFAGPIASGLPDEPSDEALMEIEIEESNFGDVLDDYDDMSVDDLKEELRKRGIRMRGKKEKLIERLRSYDKMFDF